MMFNNETERREKKLNYDEPHTDIYKKKKIYNSNRNKFLLAVALKYIFSDSVYKLIILS